MTRVSPVSRSVRRSRTGRTQTPNSTAVSVTTSRARGRVNRSIRDPARTPSVVFMPRPPHATGTGQGFPGVRIIPLQDGTTACLTCSFGQPVPTPQSRDLPDDHGQDQDAQGDGQQLHRPVPHHHDRSHRCQHEHGHDALLSSSRSLSCSWAVGVEGVEVVIGDVEGADAGDPGPSLDAGVGHPRGVFADQFGVGAVVVRPVAEDEIGLGVIGAVTHPARAQAPPPHDLLRRLNGGQDDHVPGRTAPGQQVPEGLFDPGLGLAVRQRRQRRQLVDDHDPDRRRGGGHVGAARHRLAPGVQLRDEVFQDAGHARDVGDHGAETGRGHGA